MIGRYSLVVLWLSGIVLVDVAQVTAEEPVRSLRVTTFNLWHGGDAGKQPLERSVAVIKAARADVVGLQETAGYGNPRPDRAAELAKELGWHYFDQGGRTGVISRFKISGATPRKWGVKLELSDGKHMWHFNAHFAHAPYQPYQLLKIPYAGAPFLQTAAEAVHAAESARGGQVERMLGEVKEILAEGTPVFVTGDFNEPSHLDWTAASVTAKHSPLEVAWPTTRAVATAGFVDAYRSVHQDPVKHRGITWTPITKLDDPKDRHDRIDFVFVRSPKARIRSAEVVGETRDFADIVVEKYPSDHRAVVAEVELP